MDRRTRYSPEVRERAVRLVFEQEGECSSQRSAMISIAEKFGCTTETLRRWVRRAETDRGRRAGPIRKVHFPSRQRLLEVAPLQESRKLDLCSALNTR